MGKFIDRTGQVHNGIKFIERIKKDSGRPFWKSECHCGTIFYTRNTTSIVNGERNSCGCLHKKKGRKIHGDYQTRLYNIWGGMKQRCLNSKCEAYKNYGKKGITICEEWKDYLIFKEWALENNYSDSLTIDRIDPSKNYEPSNCRWVDYTTQSRNVSKNYKNTSGVKGVFLNKHNTWDVYIGVNKKRIYIGAFKKDKFLEAVEARRQAEIRYWGEEFQNFEEIFERYKNNLKN